MLMIHTETDILLPRPIVLIPTLIMAPLQIHVTGTGTAIRRAERGILKLKAETQNVRTAEEASSILTATANKIRDAISPYCPQDEQTGRTREDAGISHYSMSTVHTSSHREKRPYKANEEATYDTSYYARAEFSIKFSDFSALDKLATQFSAMQNISIDRIDWKLTDATLDAIKGGARELAARNAIQKARDYAEVFAGLGADELETKVKAVVVTENQYYEQSTRPQLHYGKMQRARGEEVVDRRELQFEPEDVRLEVKIDGRFQVEV